MNEKKYPTWAKVGDWTVAIAVLAFILALIAVGSGVLR